MDSARRVMEHIIKEKNVTAGAYEPGRFSRKGSLFDMPADN